MARCLILGGAGFIGVHLANALERQGHEIAIFSRRPVSTTPSRRVIVGDFLDAAAVVNALEGMDYVFHLISLTTPAVSESNPFIDVETNVRMSVELFSSCVAHGIRRVVFASSGGAIYGDSPRYRHSEEDLTQPISPYGIGKSAIEDYLRFFRVRDGLQSVSLRIANVFGEGQASKAGQFGIIPTFLDRIVRGEPITVLGDGSMVRDYIYVGDLVDRIAGIVAARHLQHPVYNCGSGVGTTVTEVLRTIEKVSGLSAEVVHSPAPRSFVRRSVLDCTRIETEFGRQTQTTLEVGVGRIWDAYLRQGT